jgi:ribulose-bisphosphate carboxylase large chain
MALRVGGERFFATYLLDCTPQEAQEKALDICYEQTVEFPADITPAEIKEKIVGQVANIERVDPHTQRVIISYPIETAGDELTQFINVLFGNTSIKPGIKLERFELPQRMLAQHRGPRFGRQGLRDVLNIPKRPMLCTALKPMGYSNQHLADLCYQFALGGMDIVKDDHGLADQSFSPFEERVGLCSEAVQKANAKTGCKSIYMPNISAPHAQVLERARMAKKLGAGGLLIAPGLVGFDTMREIADDEDIALPIMSHPALLGSFTASPQNGISHYALYGQLTRLAGADATIFPNWGGRFSFSREECISIVAGSQVEMGNIKTIFPTPGGGMTMERIPEMLDVFGREVIFLMGGGLHRGADLVANSRSVRDMLEKM